MQVNYDKLWKLMIDKKINKTHLSEKAGITTNEMAKMGRNEMENIMISFIGVLIGALITYFFNVLVEKKS